ncbi:MAG TPA: metallophosphoesterase [Gemmatimonadaceae bacterium]
MTDGTLATPGVRERRVERNRRKLELLLDSVFRPGNWAARVAHRLGLQGRIQTSTSAFALRAPATSERRALRIGFASDFHAGATTHHELLGDACQALAGCHPDVLLLGGDFVSVRASYIDRLAPLLAGIEAPLGKFAVLGNHDLRADHRFVVSELERAGVRMITNEHVTLAPPFGDITICGLDDPTRGTPRADRALDGVDGVRIVLMHSPEGLNAIGGRRFDLALAGHTHGGQIALPSGRPVLIPGGPLNRVYCRGCFQLAADRPRTLLVSRGVGCSTIPVRLFAAPEVHLCLIS